MEQHKIDFESICWESPVVGVRFKAYEHGGRKLRLAEFGREFVEPDWCTKGHEKPYYIERTKNLKNRIYNNHLMGAIGISQFKRTLISTGECRDNKSVKGFLKRYAKVRWIEVEDERKQCAVEAYITAILSPKYAFGGGR